MKYNKRALGRLILKLLSIIYISMISPIQVKASSINNFIDNKTSGMVEVCKDFIDSGIRSVIPDIRISSEKPNKSPLGYTVVFNAGDGYFKDGSKSNMLVYSKSGMLISGEYAIPNIDGKADFSNWIISGKGLSFAISDDGSQVDGLSSDIEVVAKYGNKKKGVSYAMCIYDIEYDEDKGGNKLGITFGGVTDTGVVTRYINHTPTGETYNGNNHRCVHDDTWDEIIYWNNKDPYVYEQCIGNNSSGCTKELRLTKKGDKDVLPDGYFTSGDGSGGLNSYGILYELGSDHIWSKEGDSKASFEGWAGSYIRAKLNGDQDDTLSVNSGVFSSSNCLFSCIPENIQNSIGVRRTRYTKVASGIADSSNYCYDKLFLPSKSELGYKVERLTQYEGAKFRKFIDTKAERVYHRDTTNDFVVSYNDFITRSVYVFNFADKVYVVNSGAGDSSCRTIYPSRVSLPVVFCFTLK